ncbi:MAG: tryptophan synthase alpha chain [Candidatus Tokpelaia sp. JSC188]|nr:MAG: tryptophan synthase alpha chain [Candidatus Tokpelaia sp. JSC188]
MTTRIQQTFTTLKAEGRAALVTYMMAGDPNYEIALEIMKTLPQSGSDVIELGIPFSDPMADGPTIQAANLRALRNGQTLQKTINMLREFRENNTSTPVIMMGYYNPIYVYGVERFLENAKVAGVDGLLVVDLPPEMDQELCIPAKKAGINFIRLATPTTNDKRLHTILQNASGFIYYISLTGITGQTLTNMPDVITSVNRIKTYTNLPVSVGFGVKTKAQVEQVGQIADGVIVGTALVNAIAETFSGKGKIRKNSVKAVYDFVRELRSGLQSGV